MMPVQSPTRRTTTCSRAGCGDDRNFAGLDKAAQLFKALADETRLAILRQLREQGEVCACDFVACCERAQPTVSHHLKVLHDAGLLARERRGQWIYYRIVPEQMAAVRSALASSA